MKKTFCVLLLITVLSLAACGDETSPAAPTPLPQSGSALQENSSAASEPQAERKTSDVSTNDVPGAPKEKKPSEPEKPAAVKIDVDLTLLSSTMVYSEVYNMIVTPEDYIGKRIKMTGTFASFQDGSTGKIYFACLIADATACCSQGIEFILAGEHQYPDDYPAPDETITVTGIFDAYEENGNQYIQLIDAEMEY